MNKAPRCFRSLFLFSHLALAFVSAVAGVIPVDLPPPGDTPPASDKPVKVYILSGQSNMLGFGAIEPKAPFYNQVFLSADPSATASALPVTGAALFPMQISDATVQGAPVALGATSAELPKVANGAPIEVKAHLTVPYDGEYHVHIGSGASSYAVARVGGQEVYRRNQEGEPLLTPVKLKKEQAYPVEITYLQGGSCAVWLEKIDLKPLGDLRWVVEDLGRFGFLQDATGAWVKRPDVQLNDAYMGKGKTAPHGVEACGSTFGPELGFGFVMGTFHDEPVIVMKADIGNRSLGWDILPPGSERYTFDGKEYPGYGEQFDDQGKVVKFDGEGWYAGKQYDDYTAAVRAVLDNFGEKYPQFKDQGYEVAGFVWWQGHKDGPNPAHNSRYEQNLVNLIKAWRTEFNAPKAPWAIATVGFEGEDMPPHYVDILKAQKAVADPTRHPELAGTVKTIDTRPFWRPASVSPKNQGYHYNHNAETYMLTGDALGRAMVELKGGEVVYPSAEMDPTIAALPAMSSYSLKREQLAALAPALKPIVLDKLIPEYVASAPGVPAYRRNGMMIETILSNQRPEKTRKPPVQLTSQLDQLLEYYELAGIDTYGWRKFGPEMQQADWQYFSFEPQSGPPEGQFDRYRDVELPAGMAEWYTPGFDVTQAGWKTGKAPFGQVEGEKKALISSCTVSHCGCNIVPHTLWEHEVLLMRQTFKVPALEEGKRYRLVVGGAGHGWSGEGFKLFLDGQEVAEMTEGYYKNGGAARGTYIYEDLKPHFADGEITLGLQGFLRMTGHRNKPGPRRGHISVWLEEVELPPPAVKLAAQLAAEASK